MYVRLSVLFLIVVAAIWLFTLLYSSRYLQYLFNKTVCNVENDPKLIEELFSQKDFYDAIIEVKDFWGKTLYFATCARLSTSGKYVECACYVPRPGETTIKQAMKHSPEYYRFKVHGELFKNPKQDNYYTLVLDY